MAGKLHAGLPSDMALSSEHQRQFREKLKQIQRRVPFNFAHNMYQTILSLTLNTF